MFRADFSFDTDILIEAERNLVNSPKLLQKALKRRQPRLRQLVLKMLAVEPGPPHYPIRWKSEKQRRYVMALLREQNNLPYERTHDLVKAWNVGFEFDADGGDFVIENTSPIATYVIGEQQQIFHRDTGWIDAEETIDDQIVPLVLDDFTEAFYLISDPFMRHS